tara:strand:+ start:146 stop:544 length:399 start_codon:yes stop_codon:yes gene_type:complete
MNIKSSKVLVDEANKQIKTLNAIEVKKMLEKGEATLIDIRDIRELWREGTLKEATHIPRGMLEFWLDPNSQYFKDKKINEEKKIILFCALGMRSALATKSLQDMGFKNIAHVNGGFDALKNSGIETIVKEKK